MRVLLTGANGFIGSHIRAHLLQTGHQVVCAVRHAGQIPSTPNCTSLSCDFNSDTAWEAWLPRLKGIDALINCIGILQGNHCQSIQAIHELTPIALFKAAAQLGIKRIIQISALGIDSNNTPYAVTKLAADNFLTQVNTPWVILRPSLVYGSGSYGGTSLFRGLAALPGFIPVIGNGEQVFQPIHIDDLSQAVCALLTTKQPLRCILTAVGPGSLSYAQILMQLRSWLGLAPAKLIIHIPVKAMRWLAYIGNFLPNSPINTTALKMLLSAKLASASDQQRFIDITGIKPRSFRDALMQPSHVQDRWHAKLYFLKPMLRLSIALTWLVSGLLALLPHNHSLSLNYLAQLGLTENKALLCLYSAAGIDFLLGFATLLNWQIKKVGVTQLIVISVYTLILTVIAPILWLDPFGAILKNIPLMIATLIMLAIAEDR